MPPRPPPHHVIDDFLDPGTADALLALAIASADRFRTARVRAGDGYAEASAYRSAQHVPAGQLETELAPVGIAVNARLAALCAAVGLKAFDVHRTELDLTAHGDGDFYKRHIDTQTGPPGKVPDLRLLSCVYYLNRRPARFDGGELALHGFDPDGPTLIRPVHNRLAVFPSFVPHEVMPVRSTSDDPGDRRFSVNCWLRRLRDG